MRQVPDAARLQCDLSFTTKSLTQTSLFIKNSELAVDIIALLIVRVGYFETILVLMLYKFFLKIEIC